MALVLVKAVIMHNLYQFFGVIFTIHQAIISNNFSQWTMIAQYMRLSMAVSKFDPTPFDHTLGANGQIFKFRNK